MIDGTQKGVNFRGLGKSPHQKRREWINQLSKLVHILLIFSLVAVSCSIIPNNPETQICKPEARYPSKTGERPNIVFILTDDQAADTLIHMPKAQELLVDQGVQMTNFFVNVPLCCPSRATILLGQYSHNSGIITNGGSTGGFRTFYKKGLEKKTIAAGLWVSGYKTVLLGKYLNGYPGGAIKRTYIPPGWDEWYSPVVGDPYSNYDYKLNENGEIVKYRHDPEDYLTDVLREKAIDFILRHTDNDQPFFMYLAVYAPHGPAIPAPRHEHLFTDLAAPPDPSYNEEDVSDKPSYIREREPLTPEAQEEIDGYYRTRIQSLQAVDEMIAKIVETLRETGKLDNTYIFYTSDNGVHLGHHRLEAGKHTPYSVDIRVPMIVRGPGIPAGEIREQIAGNVDLAPTFAEIAETSYPNSCDGRSLLQVLRGDILGVNWRDGYLIQQWIEKTGEPKGPAGDTTLEPPDPTEIPIASGLKPALPPFEGLQTAEFKYVEYETGELEFYDLRADPYELNNLAGGLDPKFQKQLSTWLRNLSSCAGAACWISDQIPSTLEYYGDKLEE